MADGLSEQRQIVQAADEHVAEARLPAAVGLGHERTGQRPSSPHAGKFRVALALLAGLAIGAVAVAIVVLTNGSSDSTSVPWSSWKPSDSGTTGASEIADHVAPLYRISGTNQLAVVTVAKLGSSSSAAAASVSGAGAGGTGSSGGLQVAVRPDPNTSAVSLLNGHTVAYNLCGVGSPNCSIGVGAPSPNRLLLLRREALELALYTFKYIGGTDNVVAILPPGHTVTSCTGLCPKPNQKTTTKPVDIALLFLHDELRPLLGQPLGATFPEQFPPTVNDVAAAPESPLVQQVTSRGMFNENVEQAQDGSSLMVLNPLPPQ
jgi:hypothetical protein